MISINTLIEPLPASIVDASLDNTALHLESSTPTVSNSAIYVFRSALVPEVSPWGRSRPRETGGDDDASARISPADGRMTDGDVGVATPGLSDAITADETPQERRTWLPLTPDVGRRKGGADVEPALPRRV